VLEIEKGLKKTKLSFSVSSVGMIFECATLDRNRKMK